MVVDQLIAIVIAIAITMTPTSITVAVCVVGVRVWRSVMIVIAAVVVAAIC